MTHDIAGQHFGRWTVLDEFQHTAGGTRWKCRCDCGTERFVLARNLKSGKSLSCGCLNRERVRALGNGLLGQTFGDLTVIGQAPHTSGQNLRWRCRCTCGNECVVSGTRLTSGKKTHCGCKTRKDSTKKDISGQTFRMLTALYETDRRDYRGSVVWHCRCQCGRELDVSYNALAHGMIVSCGCRKEQANHQLGDYLTHVADTSIEMLRSKKMRRDNTTGVTGVYRVQGCYRAEIGFQGRHYLLGTYHELETAAAVRKEAERVLHEQFLSFYDAWKQRADQDAAWAENNPISVTVRQRNKDDFEVVMLPDMTGSAGAAK